MDMLVNPVLWIAIGVVLMVSELIIPGGVVVFLGAGAFVTAGALYLGLIEGGFNAVTLYFVSSLLLLLAIRGTFMRYFGGDESRANTFELSDDVDRIVEVTRTIGPADRVGQVLLRGSRWRALGDGREIPAGSHVRIMTRENITLMVVPVTDDEVERAAILGEGS